MTLYRLDIQIFISRFTGKLMPDSDSVLPPGVWRGAQRRRVFAIREKQERWADVCPSPPVRVLGYKNNLTARPGGGLSHLRHGGGAKMTPPPSNSTTRKARRPGDTAIDSS